MLNNFSAEFMNNGTSGIDGAPAASADSLGHLASRRVQLTLPFRLSDWTLWRKRLDVDVYEYDFDWMLRHARGFDPQEIPFRPDTDSDGSLYRSLPISELPERVRRVGDHIIYVTETYQRYFTDLTLGAEAYAGSFSSKSRSTLKRKVRKWAEACGGEIDWREYRTADELGTFHSLARGVSEKTYQENLLDAGLPADDAFQRRMFAGADRGEICGYLLFDGGGQAVAYLYCPTNRGVVYYQYLGYLADHPLSGLSPGAILLWLALQKLQADPGFRWFDFTEGSDRHGTGQKARFATGSVQCADVWILHRRLSLVFLLALHRSVDDFSESLGRLLERWGLKQRIKRWIRMRSK